MKQIQLFPAQKPVYGGELVGNERKRARPLDSKRPLHLVLKSGRAILYKNRVFIERLLHRQAELSGITAYSIAVNHDHIHLVLRLLSRAAYKKFIRAVTGLLARKFGKGLWLLLPFTRVLNWGRDFRERLEYLRKNREEAAGIRPYEPRRDWYQKEKRAAKNRAPGSPKGLQPA